MDALILSCSTGGGHNAAGYAIKEELLRRGHTVEMFDPYCLVSEKLASGIGNSYIKLVQKLPFLFGTMYVLGDIYRKLPIYSPVYQLNSHVAKRLRKYLKKNHFDVIIMPHLFPAEIITYLKKHNIDIPKTVFVATDYVCIPFTEETDCDYYVIPHKELASNFIGRGIPEEKLLPFGIPAGRAFSEEIGKKEAKSRLGLDVEMDYYLITGGSIGAGKLQETVKVLSSYAKSRERLRLIVICGNNEKLYRKMKTRYSDKIILIKSTSHMAEYMKACDLFFSKAGGLSSTEAAVAGVPLIHISPLPGCEVINMNFFVEHGMSLGVKNIRKGLLPAVERLQNAEVLSVMKKKQRKCIDVSARNRICDWLEQLAGADTE